MLDRIDGRVRDLAMSMGAREMQYPVLISRDVLDQAEYPQAFPHLLMSACRSELPGNGAQLESPDDAVRTGWCLSPAVCYHAYAQFSRCVIDRPTVVTSRGRCFRAERESAPGVRQIEFEMREIVLLGQPGWIDAAAEIARSAIDGFARESSLAGSWEIAGDPFFLPAAAGKALMQQMLKVKLEYQWPGAGGLALASINRHGAFFGRRFDIATPAGHPVDTLCIAVGLDRWAHHMCGAADLQETAPSLICSTDEGVAR